MPNKVDLYVEISYLPEKEYFFDRRWKARVYTEGTTRGIASRWAFTQKGAERKGRRLYRRYAESLHPYRLELGND